MLLKVFDAVGIGGETSGVAPQSIRFDTRLKNRTVLRCPNSQVAALSSELGF